MSVPRYSRALRQHWATITAATLIAIVCAGVVTIRAPRLYRATAQVFVAASAEATTNPGLFAGSQFSQERVKSYTQIVNSRPVTEAVVRSLGLSETPDELAERITADAPVDTVLVNLSVDDPTPQGAQEVANAVAKQFALVAAQLETPAGRTTSPVKVSIVKPARLPTGPASPNPLGNLLLASILGFGAGVAVALLRERLDTSIKTRQDVEDAVGVTTVGAIPDDPDTRRQVLVTQATGYSPRAEAFKQLRSNLKYIDLARGASTIVVTSAVADEGKSSIACNLAITLAEAGVRVTLVAADLRRPRLAEYLQIEDVVGLTDVLIGDADLVDVVQDWGPTGVLRVLPTGAIPPNPSELLGSPRMALILQQLQSVSDVVLIDAPPLLPVTDAAVLAATASGALVVVRAGRTRRDEVAQAIDTLRGVDARVLGVVLNMVPAAAASTAYVDYKPRRPAADAAEPPTEPPTEHLQPVLTPTQQRVEPSA